MEKDYYFILGISRNAKEREIKKAYKKLAFKVHPDRNKEDPIYEEIFKDVNEAYETLIDKRRRANYDLKISHRGQKFQNYSNLPPQEVVKKIIGEVKRIVKLTEGRATPTINRITVNNYLAEILSPDVIWIYNAVSENQKKELILFSIPLFRYINDFQRAEYLKILTKIIGNNDVLVIYIRKRIDQVTRDQKKIDKNYWLNYKISRFISTKWGRVMLGILFILIFYFFLSLLDNNNNHEISLPQNAVNTTITRNKKNVNVKFSKWRGNQLKTGDSPYNKYFGKGIYGRHYHNKIIIHNNRKLDVIICLLSKDKTIRNEYIRSGDTFTMTNIPNGYYFMKMFYGKYWNPNLKILGRYVGGFDTLASFSKPLEIFEMKQDKKHYSVYKIIWGTTKGTSGNMFSRQSNPTEFFSR